MDISFKKSLASQRILRTTECGGDATYGTNAWHSFAESCRETGSPMQTPAGVGVWDGRQAVLHTVHEPRTAVHRAAPRAAVNASQTGAHTSGWWRMGVRVLTLHSEFTGEQKRRLRGSSWSSVRAADIGMSSCLGCYTYRNIYKHVHVKGLIHTCMHFLSVSWWDLHQWHPTSNEHTQCPGYVF